MIYILDAYNVIHKIHRLEAALDKNLRASRDALIALCATYAASRGDISEMILVFDGNSEFNDLDQSSPPKIRLVFSETNEDADERIITILEKWAGKANKCVVSDDNFVRNQARAYATRVMSVSEFEQMIRPKVKTKNKPSARDTFQLSPKAASDITEEYRKKLGL